VSRRKQISRRVALLLTLFITLSLVVPVNANAATKVWSTTTPIDTYNRPDLPPQFDIERVEVGLFDSDLDQVHFWIQFKNILLPSQFNDGLSSWAGIFIDTNGDDQEDLRIETQPASYTKNYWQSAYASRNCTAVSWMNLDAGNENVWLGFKVSQKCLALPNKFRVQGYADYKSNDNAAFDYAPDGFATIDLGDYYNPKPKVTTAVPFSTSDSGKALANYSSVPENLADLASKLRDSVVTIECVVGTSVGTGTAWAAKVQMPSTNSYQSYLITNYHVISDCIYKGNVDVILNDKSKINGVLAAWDPDNDLAGIYVTTKIEPMLWQGATPLQGGWAGVLGSPKGLPGVLTTGIVSSVDTKDIWMTFTAPINPGNSGGPVFDSVGRVMAVATAKARDSEGFGIGNGVPLLCEVVVRCGSGQSGWTGVSTKVANDYPKKDQNLTLSSDLRTVNSATSPSIQISMSLPGNGQVLAYSTSGLMPVLTSESPLVCTISGMSIFFKSEGTCILRADQSGNNEFNSAEPKRLFIGIYYYKIMKSQSIYAEFVPDTPLNQKTISMRITSSSGLPVDATTDDFNICSIFRQSQVNFEQFVVIFNDVGNCVFTLTQDGNYDFNPAGETYVSFEILPNKTTITCIKGKLTKKVTAINPKCPKGYKKK
jgi:hypothetical protein